MTRVMGQNSGSAALAVNIWGGGCRGSRQRCKVPSTRCCWRMTRWRALLYKGEIQQCSFQQRTNQRQSLAPSSRPRPNVGTCYLTPLIGAYYADSKWGRYKAIMVFSWIYQAGMVLLAMSAAIPGLTPTDGQDRASLLQFAVLYFSLYVIALGTGGIKPNVSAFGADQFEPGDPVEQADKESFFNWFYLAVNVGSLIASLIIVYIQENIRCGAIEGFARAAEQKSQRSRPWGFVSAAGRSDFSSRALQCCWQSSCSCGVRESTSTCLRQSRRCRAWQR